MPESIHDKGYKRILSKKKNFLSLFESFISQAWVRQIREEDLELVDKSFIPKDFNEKEADIIYKLRFQDKEIIFYCLLELQSGVDFTMPFRLLIYMIELLKRIFLDTDPAVRERKEYRLPVIIPIVLYNGENAWTAVRSFREYLSGYELFGEEVIDFKYILLNINSYTDEQLLEIGNLISAVITLDKKVGTEDFVNRIAKAAKIFAVLTKDEQSDFIDWLRDVLMKKVKGGKKDIVDGLITNLMKGADSDMTYAIERMLDMVEEKGRQEGKQEGRQEGKQEERIQIARLLYKKGMDKDEITTITNLTPEEIQRIIKDL